MLISSSRKPRENPDHTQGERPEDRSARAAVASGFNNRNFFPHGSGGWKSKIRVSMEWLPSPPIFPWSLFRVCLCPNSLLSEHQSYRIRAPSHDLT